MPRQFVRFLNRRAPVVVKIGGEGGGGLLLVAVLLLALVGGSAFFVWQKFQTPKVVVIGDPTQNDVKRPSPDVAPETSEIPAITAAPETDGLRIIVPEDDETPLPSVTDPTFPSAAPKPGPIAKPGAPKPVVDYTTAKLRVVKARKNLTASALDREVWEKINPTAASPMDIPGEAPLRQSLLALVERYEKIPVRNVVANPLAEDFPGAVLVNAPRVSKRVRLPANISGWQSTGLYAPPGEIITVRLSSSSARSGLGVRIGCHSDDLFYPECVGWPRFPRITRGWSLGKAVTEVASPFGGLIYIETHGGGKSTAGLYVEVTGGVEAPYFILGQTDAKEWARLRNAPAPWGELTCRTITLSVPSSVLRTIEDPTKVLQLWEKIIDAQDWLGDLPRRVNNPERLVPDIKISMGYMHSGYPVMCHMDMCYNMTSYETLTTQGNWGFFHEYGHNHQSDEWTFSGYGETTCNIFALYCMEVIANKKRCEGGPPLDEFLRRKLADPKGANGSDDLLSIYVPVIREFGWEPLKKTFGEYRKSRSIDLDLRQMRRTNSRASSHSKRRRAEEVMASDKKKDDLAKETFVRIWSKHCKANLGPYFEKVGYTISKPTLHLLHRYKDWMPEAAGGPKPKEKDTGAKSKTPAVKTPAPKTPAAKTPAGKTPAAKSAPKSPNKADGAGE
jgi:hypothetical protein